MAAAQAQLAAAPPPGLGNFPLPPGDALGDSFLTCGLATNHAQFALHNTEGLNTFDAIVRLPLEQVDLLSVALARRAQNQGGWRMTALQTLNLKAMVWWLKDLQDRNQPIGAAFTPQDLDQAAGQLQAYTQAIKAKSDIPFPEKFPNSRQDKWIPWWESVKSYFAATYGVRRRTLSYVIRPHTQPANATPEQINEHQVTLSGPD